jgi:hypothetical protein
MLNINNIAVEVFKKKVFGVLTTTRWGGLRFDPEI